MLVDFLPQSAGSRRYRENRSGEGSLFNPPIRAPSVVFPRLPGVLRMRRRARPRLTLLGMRMLNPQPRPHRRGFLCPRPTISPPPGRWWIVFPTLGRRKTPPPWRRTGSASGEETQKLAVLLWALHLRRHAGCARPWSPHQAQAPHKATTRPTVKRFLHTVRHAIAPQ